MDEEAAIRQAALTALGDELTVSLSAIYALLRDGQEEDNAAHYERRRQIAQSLKRNRYLSPVYFDRKLKEQLIWARSDEIPSPPQLRREEVGEAVVEGNRQPAKDRASMDIRLRQLHLGVLLLTAAQAHDLELSGPLQPYCRVVYLRVEDEQDAPRGYTVWYDANQQMLYALDDFFRREKVMISSRLEFKLLEQPATYRVRITRREDDAVLAADREMLQAAKQGREFVPAHFPDDGMIGLLPAIDQRLDTLNDRLINLQRLISQLGREEVS